MKLKKVVWIFGITDRRPLFWTFIGWHQVHMDADLQIFLFMEKGFLMSQPQREVFLSKMSSLYSTLDFFSPLAVTCAL